jgi:hypothetical protein
VFFIVFERFETSFLLSLQGFNDAQAESLQKKWNSS